MMMHREAKTIVVAKIILGYRQQIEKKMGERNSRTTPG